MADLAQLIYLRTLPQHELTWQKIATVAILVHLLMWRVRYPHTQTIRHSKMNWTEFLDHSNPKWGSVSTRPGSDRKITVYKSPTRGQLPSTTHTTKTGGHVALSSLCSPVVAVREPFDTKSSGGRVATSCDAYLQSGISHKCPRLILG